MWPCRYDTCEVTFCYLFIGKLSSLVNKRSVVGSHLVTIVMLINGLIGEMLG